MKYIALVSAVILCSGCRQVIAPPVVETAPDVTAVALGSFTDGVHRIVDKENGVVCYVYSDVGPSNRSGSISCLTIRNETQVENSQ